MPYKDKLSWRLRRQNSRDGFNAEYEIKKDAMPSKDDVVLKHPENGSNIRIKDDGTIQFFAGDNLGLRLNPKYNSITFMGDKAKFLTPELHFVTDNDGLKWNYTPFNRSLANPLTEIVTSKKFGTQALMKSLTNPGTYVSSPTGGPVSPGTISSVSAFDFKGERAYNGIKHINKFKAVSSGLKEIADSIDLSSIKELL